jgi:hypothetical protein
MESTQYERRRYALLQAAATIYAQDAAKNYVGPDTVKRALVWAVDRSINLLDMLEQSDAEGQLD